MSCLTFQRRETIDPLINQIKEIEDRPPPEAEDYFKCHYHLLPCRLGRTSNCEQMTFIYGLLDTGHLTCCLSGPGNQAVTHTAGHTRQDSHGTFHGLRGATTVTINRNPELQCAIMAGCLRTCHAPSLLCKVATGKETHPRPGSTFPAPLEPR